MAAPGLNPEVLNTPERSRGQGRAGPDNGARANGNAPGGTGTFVASRPGGVPPQARNSDVAQQGAGAASHTENVHVRTVEVPPDIAAAALVAKILGAPDQGSSMTARNSPADGETVDRRRAISAYRDALALTAGGAPPLILSVPNKAEAGV